MTIIHNGYRIRATPASTDANGVIITVVRLDCLADVGFASSLDAARRLADWDAMRYLEPFNKEENTIQNLAERSREVLRKEAAAARARAETALARAEKAWLAAREAEEVAVQLEEAAYGTR